MKKRVVYSDNGQHTDLTVKLGDYYSGVQSLSIIASEDTIFIGSYFPFNHFYIKLGDRVNDQSSTMRIRHWDGKSWQDMAQVFDSTSTNACSLGQSGHVEFIPFKKNGWVRDDTTYVNGNELIAGLGTSVIYDQFWIGMSFTSSLTSNLQISWLGNIFSNDDDLKTEYPDLVRSVVLNGIESGKTDYQKESVYAAEILVKDLILKNIVLSESQLLYKEDMKFASVSKTAELIFGALGDDYKDDASKAKSNYSERLNNCIPSVDLNNDARLDPKEISTSVGTITR